MKTFDETKDTDTAAMTLQARTNTANASRIELALAKLFGTRPVIVRTPGATLTMTNYKGAAYVLNIKEED